MNPFDDRFRQKLAHAINEKIASLKDEIGGGSLIVPSDASATSMAYTRRVGMIQGLKSVLTFMSEIEADMSGKPKKQQQQER